MHSSDNNVTIDYHLSAQADGAVVLKLCGDMDLTSAPALEATLRQVTREPPPLLVLDLRSTGFLDSAGVLLLLRAYRWQRAAGKTLRLLLIPEQSAYRVLVLSGLMKLPGMEWDTGTGC